MLDDRELKARQRAMWALGEYHSFATASLWDVGPLLVEACEIAPGQRVLDVAAGRREAWAHGVELQWVQADAEALPFDDASFDVVTSSVGAIFAPHHQTVADEFLRVCRPGGTIGLVTILPSGAALELFEILGRRERYPLIAVESVLEWGREEHVRELFGDQVESLRLEALRARAQPARRSRVHEGPPPGVRRAIPGSRRPARRGSRARHRDPAL